MNRSVPSSEYPPEMSRAARALLAAQEVAANMRESEAEATDLLVDQLHQVLAPQPGIVYVLAGDSIEEMADAESIPQAFACFEQVFQEGQVSDAGVSWHSPPPPNDVPHSIGARRAIQVIVAQLKSRPNARFALLSRLPGETVPRLDFAGLSGRAAILHLLAALRWYVGHELEIWDSI